MQKITSAFLIMFFYGFNYQLNANPSVGLDEETKKNIVWYLENVRESFYLKNFLEKNHELLAATYALAAEKQRTEVVENIVQELYINEMGDLDHLEFFPENYNILLEVIRKNPLPLKFIERVVVEIRTNLLIDILRHKGLYIECVCVIDLIIKLYPVEFRSRLSIYLNTEYHQKKVTDQFSAMLHSILEEFKTFELIRKSITVDSTIYAFETAFKSQKNEVVLNDLRRRENVDDIINFILSKTSKYPYVNGFLACLIEADKKELIEKGFEIGLAEEDFVYMLDCALLYDSPQSFFAVVQYFDDQKDVDIYIRAAIVGEKIKIVEYYFLKNPNKIDVPLQDDDSETTPLELAMSNNQTNMVHILLNIGENVINKQVFDGYQGWVAWLDRGEQNSFYDRKPWIKKFLANPEMGFVKLLHNDAKHNPRALYSILFGLLKDRQTKQEIVKNYLKDPKAFSLVRRTEFLRDPAQYLSIDLTDFLQRPEYYFGVGNQDTLPNILVTENQETVSKAEIPGDSTSFWNAQHGK